MKHEEVLFISIRKVLFSFGHKGIGDLSQDLVVCVYNLFDSICTMSLTEFQNKCLSRETE